MLTCLLAMALAKPPLTQADVVDGEWRAMQVLRVRPEAYRVIKEPVVVREGPLTITLTEGVMVPVFSGFHPNDKDGIRQAKAEALAFDSRPPPPLEEGDVVFVGFVFTAAKGHFEVQWQERADHLIFANHQVTHLNRDREDWLDVAHGAPWTGELTEGIVLDTSPELLSAFLGPEDPEGSPYDVMVYGERDYGAARLRARILFADRRAAMARAGFHPGRGVAWDRVAAKHGLQARGEHHLIDLHIDTNLGATRRPPAQQPSDIDWLTLSQDWTGTRDSRRHTLLRSLDIDVKDRLVSDVITGVPFAPVDPEDPTSAPMPGARLETDEAFVVVQAVPVSAQLRVEILARLELRAVGGDFQVIQLRIPRSGSEHDWRLESITRADGTSLLSRTPLVEYHPDGFQAADDPQAQSDSSGASKVPSQMTEGVRRDTQGEFGAARAKPQIDVTRNRLESRVTLALPEPLRAGETVVVDVKWTDRWPYGDARFVESGNTNEGSAVFSQTGAASGPQGVLPRPAGSARDHPSRFKIQVVIPDRTPLSSATSGELVRSWEEAGYRFTLSAQTDQPAPWADVHVGAFVVHEEPAQQGFPAVRTRTFRQGDGALLAAETRAQINFLQGFLPDYPWPEHDVVLGPGGVNRLWWASAHGMTAAGVSGVTSVTEGGATTRQAGRHTTQLMMTHELAHQWFGQSVRPAHLSDAWLAETFAEVFATLYVDAIHGSGDRIYRQKRSDFESVLTRPLTRVPLVEAYEHPDEQAILFDYGPYLFQQMLRPRIGTDRYHAAIDLLARDYAGKALTTEQIQRWFELAAEQDLGDFFDFWVYGGFLPRKVVLRHDYAEGRWTGRIQTDVPFGTFDVPVRVDEQTYTVVVQDGSGELELELDAEPATVELDPEHRILTMNRVVRRAGAAED